MTNELAFRFRLTDIIDEYETKVAAIPDTIANYERAGRELKTAACISGTWGNKNIETRAPWESTLKSSLLKSAWQHVYNGLSIEKIASANDKKRFKQDLEKPAPFTLDNIRASFGDYLLDPRGNILRGLAEVFCNLDPAYKSHEKVKIGVKGLPKRVIIGGCTDWYHGWGPDKIRDILNAIAAYQRKPLVSRTELQALFRDEAALIQSWATYTDPVKSVRGLASPFRIGEDR